MRTIKTADLTGAALDWAVATARGLKISGVYPAGRHNDRGLVDVRFNPDGVSCRYDPSINWGFAGPIIERERIELTPPTRDSDDQEWMSVQVDDENIGHLMTGPTPLIAAMRCYVASKLGDTVEVPASLA